MEPAATRQSVPRPVLQKHARRVTLALRGWNDPPRRRDPIHPGAGETF